MESKMNSALLFSLKEPNNPAQKRMSTYIAGSSEKVSLPKRVVDSIFTSQPQNLHQHNYNISDISSRKRNTGIQALFSTLKPGKTRDIVPWPREINDIRQYPCNKEYTLEQEFEEVRQRSQSRRRGSIKKKNLLREAFYPDQEEEIPEYSKLRTPSIRNVIEKRRGTSGAKWADTSSKKSKSSDRSSKSSRGSSLSSEDKKAEWTTWFKQYVGHDQCKSPTPPITWPTYAQIQIGRQESFDSLPSSRPKGLRAHKVMLDTVRFTLPMDLRDLQHITPLQYLERFAKLKEKKIDQYKTAFYSFHKKKDSKKDEKNQHPYEPVRKCFNKFMENMISRSDFKNIYKWILEPSIEGDRPLTFTEFSCLAAFCERLLWSFAVRECDRLPRKPVIEQLDFSGLELRARGFTIPEEMMTVLLSL